MERFERYAVLLRLVRRMNEAHSWTGETHIQKSAFFLQEALGVDLGYRFILYKHGPFSFELRNDLIDMRADDLLTLQVKQPGYGPSYMPGERAELLDAAVPGVAGLDGHIRFVAERIGPRPVAELEVLATALYVRKVVPETSLDALTERIHQLKPHIQPGRARAALVELESLLRATATLEAPAGEIERRTHELE